jgi:hypothetical protein
MWISKDRCVYHIARLPLCVEMGDECCGRSSPFTWWKTHVHVPRFHLMLSDTKFLFISIVLDSSLINTSTNSCIVTFHTPSLSSYYHPPLSSFSPCPDHNLACVPMPAHPSPPSPCPPLRLPTGPPTPPTLLPFPQVAPILHIISLRSWRLSPPQIGRLTPLLFLLMEVIITSDLEADAPPLLAHGGRCYLRSMPRRGSVLSGTPSFPSSCIGSAGGFPLSFFLVLFLRKARGARWSTLATSSSGHSRPPW